MQHFHVRLVKRTWGDIVVEADSAGDAEGKAMASPNVEWTNDFETHVCLVEETDDYCGEQKKK